MNEKEYLELLHSLFEDANDAYIQYLNGGRIFRDAHMLKGRNESILLAIQNQDILPRQQRENLELISKHIQSWSKQWDKLKTEQSPDPDQKFVFDTKVRFPKDALHRILTYYNNKYQ